MLFPFIGSSSSFHTKDNKLYNSSLYLPLGKSKSITFTVQANSDAHIGFICTTCNEFYEIVIGSSNNTRSVIRRRPLSIFINDEANATSTPGILHGNEYRSFWAEVFNGLVRFGKGQIIGQNIVLKWQDHSPKIPNSIGFMTGFGSSGDWHIQDLRLYVQKF